MQAELGELAARVVAGVWLSLAPSGPRGWARREAGVAAGVSGAPAAAFNGVLIQDPAAVEAAEDLLAEVDGAGVPYVLQARADPDGAVAGIASRRGMTRQDDVPVMGARPEEIDWPESPPGFAVRALEPEEAAVHAELVSASFADPEEVFRQVAHPGMLRIPGLRCYAGTVGEEPVATGLSLLVEGALFLMNVGTLPGRRRLGYGAAVTARVLSDGFGAGAGLALLQATPDGRPVYERMGFRVIEMWHCWLAGGG